MLLYSFVVILCFLIKTNLATQLGTLVCSSNSNTEPTLIEIFQTVIPSSFTDNILVDERKKLYEKIISSNEDVSYHLNTSINALHEIGNQKIQLKSIISNGEYNIKFDDEELSFERIFLIQKSFYSLNLFCSSVASDYLGSFLKDSICKCYSSTKLNNVDNNDIPKAIINDLTIDNSLWCFTKQCSSKDYKKGFCKIIVDPLRPSCVWVY
jgi:hypothetical protein